MAETKTTKLESKVESLEQELDGARGAIRRLSEQNRSFVAEIAQLREQFGKMQVTLAQLQNTKDLYENTIHRYE